MCRSQDRALPFSHSEFFITQVETHLPTAHLLAEDAAVKSGEERLGAAKFVQTSYGIYLMIVALAWGMRVLQGQELWLRGSATSAQRCENEDP